jgi:hypothetical protein
LHAFLRAGLNSIGHKKTAVAGGLSSLAGSSFCFCENLPLLHRRWAGMAKVKKAGKKQGSVHEEWQSGVKKR